MKKSIVLLISLFFIMAISALIMKNLESTESYITQQNSKFAKTQILFLLDNVKEEISKAIATSNQSESTEDYLKDYYDIVFPLRIENIDILFTLKPYRKENINVLENESDEEYENIRQIFLDNNIYNFGYFVDIYKENEEIKNQSQLIKIFDEFKKRTYDDSILKIQDEIGFFNYDLQKANDEDKYDYYELMVTINYFKELIKAHYIFNKKGKVEYFEFSFR